MTTARIGLTGGIGSGKSTAAAMFAELGVPLLDLDAVGRQLLETEPGLVDRLAMAFGDSVVQPSGQVDRTELARIAFASPQQTRRLNDIMHPLIRREEDRWVAAQAAPFCLIEASVLIESGGASRMNAVIVVMADVELRLERVKKRGAPPPLLFDKIVARQCNDKARLDVADYVIANESDLVALRDAVDSVYQRLQQRFPAYGGSALPA